MKKMNPPPWLSAAHVPAFESLCERLQGSGVELAETDLLTVGRLAISEADLLQAERIAADCPLIVETRSNGELPHPIFKRIRELRCEVRAWMRLLPKTSGGGLPVPHVAPPVAESPPTAGPDGHDGEPPERVKRLRELLREFQAKQGAGVEAGDAVEAAVPTE